MTEIEIKQLIDMMDKKGLLETKQFLIEKYNLMVETKRIDTFRNYMTNKGLKPNESTLKGTLYSETDDSLLFTNGFSIYCIPANNTKFIESAALVLYHLYTIQESQLSIQYHHRTRYEDPSVFNKFCAKIKNFGDKYIPVQDINKVRDVSFAYSKDNNISHKFNTREINYSNILLNNPSYEMNNTEPVLSGQSEMGKVYILGYKKKS